MDISIATTVFESLSSGVRLGVFKLLVKHGLDGLVAGEIATLLDVPPNNLSFHLKDLSQAGLVTATQEGRYQRYRANIPLMLDLVVYLTEECCAGNLKQCADLQVDTMCRAEALQPSAPAQANALP